MPEDYKKVVLDYYEKKINDGSLSPSLLDPTPGSIREYCIFVYRQRSSSEDDDIIRFFFGDTRQECLGLLENSFAAKFRQLPKILNRKVENPGDKYIELIAWLVNFQPRPSTSYYKSFYTEVKSKDIAEKPEGVDKIPEPLNELLTNSSFVEENNIESKDTFEAEYKDAIKENSDKEEINGSQLVTTNDKIDNGLISKLKKTVLVKNAGKIVFGIVAVSVGTYFLSVYNKQCMYWQGDHYETIGCKIKIDQATVVALDEEKANRLKRITRVDTIGEKDLGRVWYVKIKVDSAEFYTDSGEYPLNSKKRLLPMTSYILDKYILKKPVND